MWDGQGVHTRVKLGCRPLHLDYCDFDRLESLSYYDRTRLVAVWTLNELPIPGS